ncbi:O-succinylbenzoic acid--CoA ligase [Polaribacter pacificus]|uniref:O-succinylbenzoic acid--CoA ligase n=1 Tax=Polaribacter pacificus TaxID=1775173 RepID=A0A917HZY4_9FLAO|nr:AMP-binding protein [Polaribacter pacificus]GGH00582.1 O-succinylbenzoic acid--CoA ligase [Polaribacter pacificus]
MKTNQIHSGFALNDQSFDSVTELLVYSKTLSVSLHAFLVDWFSDQTYIHAKTSGSTGAPKTIKLAKEAMVNSAKATGQFLGLHAGTSALLCMSTEYIGGRMMLVRALVLGWRLDVQEPVLSPLENNHKQYDFSAMVPLQLQSSLLQINQIKVLIVGGGVVSGTLNKAIQSVSTTVYASYGMTETVSHIALKQLNKYAEANPVPSFTALPDIYLSVDERNCLLIDAPLLSDDQIRTNDVVDLFSETGFEWLGRFDHVINSGGIKLHPEKLEKKIEILIEQRFFVAGVPDDKLGERLILLIEGKENMTLKEQLTKIPNLTKYEIPKEIYWLENFVETETKKIQRKKTLDLISYKSSK